MSLEIQKWERHERKLKDILMYSNLKAHWSLID